MKAETRIENGWKRLYVMNDGQEFNVPLSKEIILAQGLALMLPDWKGPTEEREIFSNLKDEESASEWFTGSTDPEIVGLVIRASREPAGKLDIPSREEGLAEIAKLRTAVAARK